MLTGFRELFSAAPRKTEQIDPRTAIRRHDSDYPQNSRKRREFREELPRNEDDTTVSIEALAMFLDNVLQSQEGSPDAESGESASEGEDVDVDVDDTYDEEPDELPQVSPIIPNPDKAAAAVNAYKSIASNYTDSENPAHVQRSHAMQSEAHLSAEDIRTIHKLLADIKYLSGKGVQSIRIIHGENFLDSIREAIDRIKHPEKYHT